jgi:hypothetical protein
MCRSNIRFPVDMILVESIRIPKTCFSNAYIKDIRQNVMVECSATMFCNSCLSQDRNLERLTTVLGVTVKNILRAVTNPLRLALFCHSTLPNRGMWDGNI